MIFNYWYQSNILDLVVECASNEVNHPVLDTVQLVIFGLGSEAGDRVSLKRESLETWRQTDTLKM